jgi:AcrR family transcriptional regulator
MTSSASTGPAMRADAASNRLRVLSAGARLLSEQGVEATLNDVARAAGVGVATVYRNFPNREALLDGLFQVKLDQLVELADHAAGVGDAAAAFDTYLHSVMEAHATDRGVVPVLMRATQSAQFAEELAVQLGPRVQPLIEAAQAAGSLRDGFTIQDLCLLSAMVGSVADLTRDTQPMLWERYAQMLIDGTRPPA